MTAAFEEPEFVPTAGDTAPDDSLVDPGAIDDGDTAADPQPEPAAPPPHPWRFWLAWSAIAIGALLFGRSWWQSRQHAIAVERTNEAVERISAGVPNQAVSLLTEAVEHDPRLAVAWANRAGAFIALQQYDNARRDCETALKHEPGNAVALANLGVVLRESGDLAGARDALSRSISRDQRSGQPWLIRAGVALALGDHEAAIKDATEALQRLNDSRQRALTHEIRGTALLARREFNAALSDFSEASRLQPDRPEHQLHIAECCDGRGELAEAESHATNAVSLAADPGPYYERRASLRLRLRKFAEAVDDCNRALETSPESPRVLTFRAAARLELAEYVEAIADCDASLKLDPKFVSARLVRGDAWRRRGEPAHAVEDYSEVIRQQPDLMMAWFGRGVARSQMRDYDGAISDYSRAIELGPDFAAAWFNRSIAHEALGKVKEAKSDRQKALELDPNIGSVGRTEAT